MKTYTIKDLLKKEVMLVELPENTQLDVLVDNPLWKDGIKFLTGTEEKFHFIEGSYTLLGKPSEIREEDARELVESWESVAKDGTMVYENYNRLIPKYKTATESFNSALESVVQWENPVSLEREKVYRQIGNTFTADGILKCWHEAESRTFDRNRSIILVKN